MRMRRPVLGVVATLLAVAACSAAEPPAALRCEALEAAVTAAVPGTLTQRGFAADGCTFSFAPSDDPSLAGTVSIRLESAGEESLAGVRATWPDGEDVPGVGDGAYWVPDVDVLYALRASNLYAIQLVGVPGAVDRRAAAIGLMQALFAAG